MRRGASSISDLCLSAATVWLRMPSAFRPAPSYQRIVVSCVSVSLSRGFRPKIDLAISNNDLAIMSLSPYYLLLDNVRSNVPELGELDLDLVSFRLYIMIADAVSGLVCGLEFFP